MSARYRCPACSGYLALVHDCEVCSGRGELLSIPFPDRNWDHIAAGLHLGGHQTAPGGASTVVRDEFDVVVSLFTTGQHGPDAEIPHHIHSMADDRLSEDNHAPIQHLATLVADAMDDGQSVLVRCHAGLNRSALVAGLALLNHGWTTDQVLDRMRAARSPHVLFNASFVAYLRLVEDTARSGRTRCEDCAGQREHFGVACGSCAGMGYLTSPVASNAGSSTA